MIEGMMSYKIGEAIYWGLVAVFIATVVILTL